MDINSSGPVAYNKPVYIPSRSIKPDSPNVHKPTGNEIKEQLNPNQQPLGTQFKSYELTAASNYYTLDPYQYSITKFKYNLPGGISNNPTEGLNKATVGQYDFQNDPGLRYRDIDFDKLLPAYTSTKKSVNDFSAQSYHRFLANDGYFNASESTDNSDLWYYGADAIARRNDIGLAGAGLNVQEVRHIVFPEPQRGGTNTRNLSKYSWTNIEEPINKQSWGAQNAQPVDNNGNCEFFNYNSTYTKERVDNVDQVYKFNSDYLRNIGLNGKYEGSMPFNPGTIN
jgi:hypothetical protein